MPIEIRINEETSELAREAMLALLGLTAGGVPWGEQKAVAPIRAPYGLAQNPIAEIVKNDNGLIETTSDGTLVTRSSGDVFKDLNADRPAASTRERGKPAPGRARRTKEEIAEDEAAARASEDHNDDDEVAGAAAAGLPTSAISTGEERVGPEDDAETVEQDEADEAAETAAAVAERPADKKLTHDDVRQSLGAYVKLYGMAAAQEDGPKVIALALKDPTIVKVSAIPETQEALGAVVAGIDEMTSKNPFQRAKVA